MFKSKSVVVGLAFGAVLLLAGAAFAGVVDPCSSSVAPSTASGCLNSCSAGDGTRLDGMATPVIITVTVKNSSGQPIPDILWSDFWLIGCDPDPANYLCLAGGSGSSNADDNTDSNGQTTISGTMAVGGYSDGISVVCQGFVLEDDGAGCTPYCLGITVVSADVDRNGEVGPSDVGFLAAHYPTPSKPYDARVDYNCDGAASPGDVGFLANHYAHLGQDCLPQ